MKKTVLVFFGGESVEHDISIITAVQVLKNIDEKLYQIIPVYITRSGIFVTGDNLRDAKIYGDFNRRVKKCRYLTLVSGKPYVAFRKNGKYTKFQAVDFALLCTHGKFGEDGGLQGTLECSHIPYSSCNLKSSALTMDKIFTKDVLVSRKIPNLPYFAFDINDFKGKEEKLVEEISCKIKFPLILKPANLGSSIGIQVCKNKSELQDAIVFCAKFDRRILVEKFLEDFTEYNCACVHMNNELKTSKVMKISKNDEIFSFKDKYLKEKSENFEKVKKSFAIKIKNLTEKVYRIFDCFGVVRVDFLLDNKTQKLFVNELNSIPGSLGFYLFDDLFSFRDFLNCLIEEGCERAAREKYLSAFDSEALDIFEKIDELNAKK